MLRTWNHIKENMPQEESEISPKTKQFYISLVVQQRERINAVLQQLRVGWTSCGLEEIRIIE